MSQDGVFAFRMSFGKSIVARLCAARFLLLMASLVLGLNYSADALATCARVLSSTGAFTGKCVHPESTTTTCLCSTATTSIKLGATHTGIEIACGDPSAEVVLGKENLHEYFAGISGGESVAHEPGPRKIRVEVGAPSTVPPTPPTTVKCTGRDLKTNPPTDLGTGNFKYQVQYEIDIATNADLTKKTAENDCVNFNPDAPPTKGKTSCRVNQSCTNVSGSEAEVKVEAYCQAGVAVFGELTWVPTHPDEMPPKFTNCQKGATNCTLKLGGTLPLDDQNRVSPELCNLVFPKTANLAEKQMLSFTQKFAGQCFTPTSVVSYDNPVGVGTGASRECHSDYGKDNGFIAADQNFPSATEGGEGFDNTSRGCSQVLTDGKKVFAHTATAVETAKTAPVTIEVSPQTLNLGCLSTGKDAGVIKATICGREDFDPSKEVAFLSNGKLNPDVAPVLQTVKPISFLIEQAIGGNCGSDLFTDVTFTYPTCTKGGGVANVVVQQNPGITNKTVVPLELQGTLIRQTDDPLPKIIGGTDTVEVVNAPPPQ